MMTNLECYNELHDCCTRPTSLLDELEEEEMVAEQLLKEITEGKKEVNIQVNMLA